MLTRVTDTIIEELIDATCSDTRSRHFFLHALHGLVRVAKAEQLQELRMDVKLSTGEISQPEGCDSDSRAPT
ncbi:hypothetical protein HH213_18415 [Duganella dendranthematis]|jgi:hypothetical protein|uniref:Uncharacterized protein n=1 Tax=Duganella dendranthematis TaxID=2728021 RepID=A0ABX6MCL6_9BURK|nr:hypothetical protein [Duganella dendranthematis]QJD91891.1 hypothetical protein HH213_18415 [Duganella dendranthematis]